MFWLSSPFGQISVNDPAVRREICQRKKIGYAISHVQMFPLLMSG